MKYFEITPEDFATAENNGRGLRSIVEEKYNDDLADLQARREMLLGALKDIPFGRFAVDFHSYEPHIEIPWDDRDPVKVLGLGTAIWKQEGEQIAWSINKYETYYRHHLTGLKLTVQKTPKLPGSVYAIYRNSEGVRYVGKIVEVQKEGEDGEDRGTVDRV